MQQQLRLALVLLAGAALLVGGLIALGRHARQQLLDDQRFSLAFDDIDCPPPPGGDRLAFLHEVQYLGRFPDRLRTLDEELRVHLGEALVRHPWVDRVEAVIIQPPNRVSLRPVFRVPVLAVRWGGQLRAVDGSAVLLPSSAPLDALPVLEAPAPPQEAAGRAWGDPSVVSVAAVAALLHRQNDRLRVTALEVTSEGVVLRCGWGRAVWGSAPGQEKPDEAHAEQKLARLQEQADAPARSDTLDLRTAR